MVCQHALCFIILEVKMPYNCSPKARVIQSHVHKESNFLSFGNKLGTGYKTWINNLKHYLGINPRLSIVYELVIKLVMKHRLGYKTWAAD